MNNGLPGKFCTAHVLPPNPKEQMWNIETYNDLGRVSTDFEQFVLDLESELEKKYIDLGGKQNSHGIVLVGFSVNGRLDAETSLNELELLAKSANKIVLDKFIQTAKKTDPRYLVGKGKLKEINLRARHIGADTLVFNKELTPAQVRAINAETDLEIVDRTQIILEIFADRATTSEGKLQVELARAQYELPRLVGKGVEFSQLGGGIGTRGPGEKKLEEQRRTLRKQIDILEKKIDELSRRRSHTRKQRMSHGIHTATFIGYTNAGKSTLFNSLTRGQVVAEDKLFSTLNPTTRKLMLPGGRQILVTDTVGFISELPQELVNAFRATLEELGESSLLVHVADISDPLLDEKMESVEKILSDTGYSTIPRITVLNKSDKVTKEIASNICRRYGALALSAKQKDIKGFYELVEGKLSELENGLAPVKKEAAL
ncbi:MAG: GTPase HflX [Candidatus Dadabacteria bacterium]|nr:GTPase HflX [Candidatus Dadabacteria bacterium]